MSDNKAQNNDINQIIASNIKEDSDQTNHNQDEKDNKPKQKLDNNQELGNLNLKERMLYLKDSDQTNHNQDEKENKQSQSHLSEQTFKTNSKTTINPNQSFFEQIKAKKQAKQNNNQNPIDQESINEQPNNKQQETKQKPVKPSYNDNYQVNNGEEEKQKYDINENPNRNEVFLFNNESSSHEKTKNQNSPTLKEEVKEEEDKQEKEAAAIKTAVVNKISKNKNKTSNDLANYLKKEVKHTAHSAATIPYHNKKTKNKILNVIQEQKTQKSGYFVWGHYFAFMLTFLTLFFMFLFSNVVDYYDQQNILVNILNTLFISGMFFIVFNNIIYYGFKNVHQKII